MAALINERKYTVGINVNNADELEGMGAKLRTFFDEIGDGDIDIQLSVNPLLAEQSNTHAIGFTYEPAEEYYEEVGDEPEDKTADKPVIYDWETSGLTGPLKAD